MAEIAASSRASRGDSLLVRLGLVPSTGEVLGAFLDEALPASGAVALDAGCGKWSALSQFRPRVAELVGVDIHEPAERLPWLDRFVVADVCRDVGSLAPASFDVVLSSFTVEHFADPPAAMTTLATWVKPGGWVVVSTVNRRHPLVNAYLSLPRRVGRPLQRLVKATESDAHPLVGVCNTPGRVSAALAGAGLERVEVVTTDHLARAWRRRRLTFLVGLLGDLAFHRVPLRRSTIVARARRPA